MIGDDIEVTVVDIRGDKVRLGITAPKEISVHRKEVYDAIRRENRAAAQVKPEDLSGLGKVAAPKPNDRQAAASAEGNEAVERQIVISIRKPRFGILVRQLNRTIRRCNARLKIVADLNGPGTGRTSRGGAPPYARPGRHEQSWRIDMARINTNVASLTAQRGLAKSTEELERHAQRLSSGLRINRGADDPAGLIASESLRSEITGINQAVDNSQRASNVIATAEGALNEVASLLLNIKSLVVQAANSGALSPDEIQANQLQVDSAVESITRIANTTTFAGLKPAQRQPRLHHQRREQRRDQVAAHRPGQLRHQRQHPGADQRHHQRPDRRAPVPRQLGSRSSRDAGDHRQRGRGDADVRQRHRRVGDRLRGQPHQRVDRRERPT